MNYVSMYSLLYFPIYFCHKVKTDWRASLTPAALSDLLTVQLLSPDVEDYDPTPAINLWLAESVRMRRPNLMDKDN